MKNRLNDVDVTKEPGAKAPSDEIFNVDERKILYKASKLIFSKMSEIQKSGAEMGMIIAVSGFVGRLGVSGEDMKKIDTFFEGMDT